jgi:arylsulfatase A-like enzyme
MKQPFIFLLSLALSAHAADLPPPNFVVILGEAQGWSSMSVPQDDRNPGGSTSDYIRTPHLDSIALSGMRFSDSYAASPRCTPTRAALLTGRSPARLHMTFVNENKKEGLVNPGDKVICPPFITELPKDIETLGTLLKKHGYATAHFGKWHLGRANPREHGFDENDGANSNGGPENSAEPNPKQCYATAKLGNDFISRQVQAKKPFYLQISHYPGKAPDAANPDTLEAVRKRLGTRFDFQRIGMAAGNEEIDKTIGLVLAKIKELGISGNTYIIYTADHGAQGRNINGALTNGKGTVWEGGLRVPLLIAGPQIKPGLFCHSRVSTVDLFPTIAELAGIDAASVPRELEGVSLVPLLKKDPNIALTRPREEFVVHFPHYDKDEAGPASAIFFQSFKLICVYETKQYHLFDLATDVGESKDLASSKPELVKLMDKRMLEYLQSVKAGMPVPNPDYVASGVRSGDRHGGKQGGGKNKKSAVAPDAGNQPPSP